MNRTEVLEVALKLITQDRAKSYGDPIEVYGLAYDLFDLWKSKTKNGMLSSDYGMMFMKFVKIARMARNIHHVDNFTDDIGYTALLCESVDGTE